MSHDTAMTLLPICMIILATAALTLGYLLGCDGTLLALRLSRRAARRARRAAAAARRAEGRAALAEAQRDDLRAQLERAEQVISETTHAVHRAGTLPDLVNDPGTTALMDAVTDDTGRALGSGGRHAYPGRIAWDDETGGHAVQEPCPSAVTSPFYAGAGPRELWCDHDAGHDGPHSAPEVGATWDDDGVTTADGSVYYGEILRTDAPAGGAE